MVKGIIAKQLGIRIGSKGGRGVDTPVPAICSLLSLGVFACIVLLHHPALCWAQGGGFVLLSPIDKAVVTPTPPPMFVWQGPTDKKVTVQFSTDANFPKKGTISAKVTPQTVEGNNVAAFGMKLWERKVLKKLRKIAGTDEPIFFWRVAVGKGKNVQMSDAREMAVKNAIRAALTGRVLDGANLNGDGIQATITLTQADGDGIPLLSDGTSTFLANADGTYSAGFNATSSDQIFMVEAAAQPYQTMSRAFRLSNGTASPDMYLSNTVIAGKALDPAGNPIPDIDIWVMRNDSGDGETFVPYEIAGGRDFLPPVPPSGMDFGFDTDALGKFEIPVRVPNAIFRLVFAVDKKTDLFVSRGIDLFVTPGQVNTVSVTLESQGTPTTASIFGQVFDGRDLNNAGLQATIDLFEEDGVTEIEVNGAGDNTFDTAANGTFQATFNAGRPDQIVLLKVMAADPFKPATRAVRLQNRVGAADIYLSSSVIQGRATDPSGTGAEVDIWVMRNDNGDGTTFSPYAIAGGRDFLPPIGRSGVRFGDDTDAGGYYQIPVRVPGELFRLVFVVDRQTDKYNSTSFDVLVNAGDVITQDIQLAPAGAQSFSNDIQPIFDGKCITCHSGASPPQGLNLSTGVSHSNLVNVESKEVPPDVRVKPFDKGASYIFEKVSGTPRVGARMPLVGGPLTSDQIDRIGNWIDQGALEN